MGPNLQITQLGRPRSLSIMQQELGLRNSFASQTVSSMSSTILRVPQALACIRLASSPIFRSVTERSLERWGAAHESVRLPQLLTFSFLRPAIATFVNALS